jgi:hypothetical protein
MGLDDTELEARLWERFKRTEEFVNTDLLNLRLAMWALIRGVRDPSIIDPERAVPDLGDVLDWARTKGHDRISQHIAIGLWTALEVHAEDVFVLRCMSATDPIDLERFAGLRVRFSDFMSLSDEERWRLAWGQLDVSWTQRDLPGRHPIDRYDKIFGSVGITVDVMRIPGQADDNEATRAALRELAAVRNVIVHRGGQVDRRLAQLDPQRFMPGEHIEVADPEILRYGLAVHAYSAAVCMAVDPDFNEE